MSSLIERLKKGEILISDGAMGTSLQALHRDGAGQAAGLEPGLAPEEWNISKPEAVKKVHKSFIDAGCDMIITNTFGANPIKLNRAGLEKKIKEINKGAVKIAKEAAKNSIYVLGDIGPTGEFLKEKGGTYDWEEFYKAFLEQAYLMHEAGVDGFIIETMSDLDELQAAIYACKEVPQRKPIIASMTFTSTLKGYRTMSGVSVEQAVLGMLKFDCDVIGANCGCGSRQMAEIMSLMRKAAGKEVFLIAQPNAGMPKLINGKTVFDETPEDFAKSVMALKKSGVNIIGGCCGTTPEHIREIVKINHTSPRRLGQIKRFNKYISRR